MKQTNSKPKMKNDASLSVRLNDENTIWLQNILREANRNRIGRKVKPNEVIALLKEKLTPSDLEMLRTEPEDYNKQEASLRQKYVKEFGPISKKSFLGFMMSADYPAFLLRHRESLVALNGNERTATAAWSNATSTTRHTVTSMSLKRETRRPPA